MPLQEKHDIIIRQTIQPTGINIQPKQKAPELFKSKFLNKLTWSHPLFIFIMYALISAVMIYNAVDRFHLNTGTILAVFIGGFFFMDPGRISHAPVYVPR